MAPLFPTSNAHEHTPGHRQPGETCAPETQYRNGDVNMSSAWECSRNDVNEGFAVIAAALAVGVFQSAWPDIVIAFALLIMFLRSAVRVLGEAWRQLYPPSPQH